MDKKIKNYIVKSDSFEPNDRTIISYISTKSPDRYQDTVQPSGVKLENYKKNPVVLFNHDKDKVIGKNLWIKSNENGLVAKTQFAKTTLAQDVMNLFSEGFLNAFSIGFIPEDLEENEFGGYNIKSWDLLEYSAVSIPANPEALALAYKSVKSEEMKEIFEKQIEQDVLLKRINTFDESIKVLQIELDTYKSENAELLEKIAKYELQNEQIENMLKMIAENKNELDIIKNKFENKNKNDEIQKLVQIKLNEILGK